MHSVVLFTQRVPNTEEMLEILGNRYSGASYTFKVITSIRQWMEWRVDCSVRTFVTLLDKLFYDEDKFEWALISAYPCVMSTPCMMNTNSPRDLPPIMLTNKNTRTKSAIAWPIRVNENYGIIEDTSIGHYVARKMREKLEYDVQNEEGMWAMVETETRVPIIQVTQSEHIHCSVMWRERQHTFKIDEMHSCIYI